MRWKTAIALKPAIGVSAGCTADIDLNMGANFRPSSAARSFAGPAEE